MENKVNDLIKEHSIRIINELHDLTNLFKTEKDKARLIMCIATNVMGNIGLSVMSAPENFKNEEEFAHASAKIFATLTNWFATIHNQVRKKGMN